jgi:hypothetical protein
MASDNILIPPPAYDEKPQESVINTVTFKVKDELHESMSEKIADSMRDRIAKLELKDEVHQKETKEFVRMQKDGLNMTVTYVVCTILTVYGGFIASSDEDWFVISGEYSRYVGLLIIAVAIAMGPVSLLLANALWHVKKRLEKWWPCLFK